MINNVNFVEELAMTGMSMLNSPIEFRERHPLREENAAMIERWRNEVRDILNGVDDRFLAIVGPCSMHNSEATLSYLSWLSGLAERFSDRLLIVGRACFEKPRTRGGWEGSFSDWDGLNSGDIGKGIDNCRDFLLRVVEMGLPMSMEIMDQNSEPFFSDLLSLSWIGARTVEAMTLRRAISAMSMPVGVKNSTSGDIASAVDAMVYASLGKNFLGLSLDGHISSISSSGNPDTFLIMRGGKRPSFARRELDNLISLLAKKGVSPEVVEDCERLLSAEVLPNYFKEDIDEAARLLKDNGLRSRILIDASHGNSEKDYVRQIKVWRDVIEQRINGNTPIIGAMLESYNKSGNQKCQGALESLDVDISVTDACLGRIETEELLTWTYERLSC